MAEQAGLDMATAVARTLPMAVVDLVVSPAAAMSADSLAVVMQAALVAAVIWVAAAATEAAVTGNFSNVLTQQGRAFSPSLFLFCRIACLRTITLRISGFFRRAR